MYDYKRLEYLKNINQEIKALEDSLLVVRTRLAKITPKLSSLPLSHNVESDQKMVNGIARIIELEKTYTRKIAMLAQYETDILNSICKIDNSVYRTILIERYINGKDFHQIADIFPYSYNHVCKLHASALEEYYKKSER